MHALAGRLKSPFPYPGGKSMVARFVWERLGHDVPVYVEPFFGSGAVLLLRPGTPGCENVNDLSGYVSNFWRAVKGDPEAVACHADNPVNENDLHARHWWLVTRKADLVSRLEGDPEYYDAKAAGWWCWGMCCWIGSGFCYGDGPWSAVADPGGTLRLVKRPPGWRDPGEAPGLNRNLVEICMDRGLNAGVTRSLVQMSCAQGVSTVAHRKQGLTGWMMRIHDRMRTVRVACGDWKRVVTPACTTYRGVTAVFLDAPYSLEAGRCDGMYERDDLAVSHEVREWATLHGDNPLFRIALCGYDGEHVMPDGWETFAWKAKGGMGNRNKQGNANRHRERIWFSPHCLKPAAQLPLSLDQEP